MKTKIFLAIALVGFAFALSSCDKNDKGVLDELLETRAQALGFENAEVYVQSVRTLCAQGNHENCHILPCGEHRICDNVAHRGQHHNGNHHNGANHENCGSDKHLSCCLNTENNSCEKHRNGDGNHHGGGHH